MSRRVLLILASFALVAGSGPTAHAQGGRSDEATETNGTTQSTQATAASQSAAQNSTANSSSGNSGSPQPTAKKVWTNEDLSGQDPNAGLSSVGRGNSGTARRAVAARPATASGRNAKWYQAQIARLQAKIPAFDSQIAELQAAIDGKATGDGKTSVRSLGVRMDDWSREMAELQQKRKDTLDQISALQDQARHNGVAPNAIP